MAAAADQSVIKWASNSSIAIIIALLIITLSINSAQCRLVTPPIPASTSRLPPANPSIPYKTAAVSGFAPPPYRPIPPPPPPNSLDVSPVLKRVYAPRPPSRGSVTTTVSATHPSSSAGMRSINAGDGIYDESGGDSAGSGSSISSSIIGGGRGSRSGTGGIDIPPINVPVNPGTGWNVHSP